MKVIEYYVNWYVTIYILIADMVSNMHIATLVCKKMFGYTNL